MRIIKTKSMDVTTEKEFVLGYLDPAEGKTFKQIVQGAHDAGKASTLERYYKATLRLRQEETVIKKGNLYYLNK